jgi:hypothetical protein
MINGAHVIIQSKEPEADRAFFRDVLGLTHVDVGGGWLIFALPPAEVAVHPSDKDGVHEFYLMCEDVSALVDQLSAGGIDCGPIEDQGWGLLTSVTLPGGGSLGIYEPRHARPSGNGTGGSPSKKAGAARGVSKSRAAAKTPATKRAPTPAPRKQAVKAKPAKRATRKPAPKPAAKRAPKRAPARKRR